MLMQSTILEEQGSNGYEPSRASARYLKKIEKRAAKVDTVEIKGSKLESVSNMGKVYHE